MCISQKNDFPCVLFPFLYGLMQKSLSGSDGDIREDRQDGKIGAESEYDQSENRRQ